MKKFVGSVNGKSFDNEEDWKKAAKEAIKESDGNIAISSYYSYKNDKDSEEEDEKESDNRFVGTNEYFLGNRKPDVVNENGYVYNVPEDLLNRIKDSINKDSIKKKLEYHLANLDRDETLFADRILSHQTDIESLEKKISDLKEKIKADEEARKDLYGKKKYYDTILNEINRTYIEEKVFQNVKNDEKEEKKEVVEEKKPTFEDVLKSFGTLTLYDIFKKNGLIV